MFFPSTRQLLASKGCLVLILLVLIIFVIGSLVGVCVLHGPD
jgi:hypothetical protein